MYTFLCVREKNNDIFTKGIYFHLNALSVIINCYVYSVSQNKFKKIGNCLNFWFETAV